MFSPFHSLSMLICIFAWIESAGQFYLAPSVADAQINYNQTCNWQVLNNEPMPFLTVQEWTWNSDGCSQGSIRGLYKFDLNISVQPNEIYDDSAEMLLFFPDGSTETHQYYTTNGANEFLIRPITQDWIETTVSWDNQPLADEVTAIEVPASSTMPSTEDYVVDISPLAREWICNGLPNYGVSLRQVFEGETYRRVTFTTREHLTEAERPSVKLYYARIEPQGPPVACVGEEFMLNANLQFAAHPEDYTFSWEDLTTGVVYSGAEPIVTLQQLGVHNFVLTATNTSCQTATSTLDIIVEPTTLSVNAGDNQSGSCVEVFTLEAIVSGAAGAVTYTWSEDGNIVALGSTADVQTQQTTTYTVLAEDECGSAQDIVEVEIIPSVIDISVPQTLTTTCIEIVDVLPEVSGAQGQISYAWISAGDTLSDLATLSEVFAETSSVELNVTDECGNTASENFIVTVEQVPILITLPNDTTICAGYDLQLHAEMSGGSGILSGTWTGMEEQGNSPVVSPSNATNLYEYTVIDQCGNTAQQTMLVYTETVVASFESATEDNLHYQFTDASVGAESVIWHFPDATINNVLAPAYFNSDLNSFVVELEAIGPGGCIQIVSQQFDPPAVVYIPNGFTPNGDGLNDVLLIQGNNLKNVDFRIYNRWGENVYTSNTLNGAWSGGYHDGEYYVPDGTYYFTLEYTDSKNQRYEHKGHILLVR